MLDRLLVAVEDTGRVRTDELPLRLPDGTDRYTFHVRDGMGIKMLQRAGIEVAVISGRSSTPVAKRCADLGITRVHLGIDAKLPTLDEARAMLLAVMQAPVVKLARTLNEVPGKLVRTVAAIADQKQAEG